MKQRLPDQALGTARTGDNAAARKSVRGLRWLALGILGIAFLGIGSLVVTALRGPSGLTPPAAPPGMAMPGMVMPGAAGGGEPATTTGAPLQFSGLLAGWRYQATVANRSDKGFELGLRLIDEGGAPAPESVSPVLRLAMLDHGMTMPPMPMERAAAGQYTARGRWSMSGRWRMDVLLPDGLASLDVRVP
jgi:hypothetical protein